LLCEVKNNGVLFAVKNCPNMCSNGLFWQIVGSLSDHLSPLRVRSVKLWSMLYTIMFLDIWATITFWIAFVASVSVRFRSKERETRVKDRAENGSFNFSRDQNRKSPSTVSFCSETKRKRLLRRLHSEGLISGLSLRGGGRGFPRLLRTWSVATFKVNRRKIEPKETPSCLIPYLLFVFTWQLKILVTTLNWQKLNSIEAVERKAARFCKNCWNREPRTVTHLIRNLNWEPLQVRRERAKQMLFFKISRGLVAIQMLSYVQPLRYCRTRQYHPARYIAVNCGTKAEVQGEFLRCHDKLVELPTSWSDYSAKPNLKGFKAGVDNFYMNWFIDLVY